MQNINIKNTDITWKSDFKFDVRDKEPIHTSSFIQLNGKVAFLTADIKDCKIEIQNEYGLEEITYDEFCDEYNKYLEKQPIPTWALRSLSK